MAVISLELNKTEKDMVSFLADYYERDDASLIKYAVKELYEDILDRQVINEFEENAGEVNFVDADKIWV